MNKEADSGIGAKLRAFDFYKKLPQDIAEPTMSGALVSIVSTVIMLLLFISEFNEYLDVKTQSEMFIDVNRGSQTLPVNLNIELFNYPCEIMSLDIIDKLGTHIVDYQHNLDLVSRDSVGRELWRGRMDNNRPRFRNAEEVKNSIAEGRSCQIEGSLEIFKVPGNFHISAHAFNELINQVQRIGALDTLNLSHRVHHLSFGSDQDVRAIRNKFNVGQLSPLDGQELTAEKGGTNSFAYYLKVVPTTFEEKNEDDTAYFVHQFTANYQQFYSSYTPVIQFEYELSPVTVKYSKLQKSFASFMIEICAIIGGVYTVAGLIDAFVYSTVSKIFKSRIGKLT